MEVVLEPSRALLESASFTLERVGHSPVGVIVSLYPQVLVVSSAAQPEKRFVSIPLFDVLDARASPLARLEVVTWSAAAAASCTFPTAELKRSTYVFVHGADAVGGEAATRAVSLWAAALRLASVGLLPAGVNGGAPPSSFPSRPTRPLLVLVNPSAGPGLARAKFESQARAVLEDAGCVLTVVQSERPRQTTEMVRSMPAKELLAFTGIVVVGGDGSLAEVVDGLMARHDWATVLARVVIGILPGGSGNGLAHSLTAAAGLACTMTTAALLIAKGLVTRIDLASTFVLAEPPAPGTAPPQLGSEKGALRLTGASKGAATPPTRSPSMGGLPGAALPPALGLAGRARSSSSVPDATAWGRRHWSFLSTEWAIVADMDLESERLRCLGAARFDVYGAWRGLCLRKYSGRFSYLPAAQKEWSGSSWRGEASLDRVRAEGVGHSEEEEVEEEEAGGKGEATPREAGPSRVGLAGESCFAPLQQEGPDAGGTLPALQYLQPFTKPVPLSWRTVEGTFTFLWVTHTSHQSGGVAISPATRAGDGVISVALIRDTNACGMLSALLAIDDKGSLLSMPGVESIKCLAWRLEPLHRGPPIAPRLAEATDPSVRTGHGHVAVDGEPVRYGPVQSEVHQGLLRVFGPGPAPSSPRSP